MPGGAPGLQNQCGADKVPGGFDSHSPPPFLNRRQKSTVCSWPVDRISKKECFYDNKKHENLHLWPAGPARGSAAHLRRVLPFHESLAPATGRSDNSRQVRTGSYQRGLGRRRNAGRFGQDQANVHGQTPRRMFHVRQLIRRPWWPWSMITKHAVSLPN